MSDARTCSECGTPLNNDAAEGFCPTCMLQGALALGGRAGAPSPAASKSSFGDYELLEEIARGGMGVVYRARQVRLDRIVALKLILAGRLANIAAIRRFRAEAAIAARLRHPNIVAIHEIGEEAGQHFFSMDYVDGPNLADFARQQPISIRQAALFLKTIANAIHYAHTEGILHRDLKPSNILIDGAFEPRITDFGLARDLKADSNLTLTGQVLGSPNYISPEQASGKGPIGVASDVYSLGAILYHLLSGRPPFAAETLTDTLQQVTTKEAVSPRLLNPSVPRDLETICLKCLEKDPGKRYATAAALAEDLSRFLSDTPIAARPVSRFEGAWRWCRRKPTLTAVIILMVVVSIGSPIATLRINQERRRAEAHATAAQKAVTRLEIEKAEQLFDADNSSAALAYLARVLRREPTNRVVAERIFWALSYRNFSLPTIAFRHSREITSATLSPDGARVATASKDDTAQIWNSFTGAQVIPPLRHKAAVNIVRFSADGAKVATGSDDNTARVWDTQSGEALTMPLRHSNDVVAVGFSADGSLVGTAARDKTACIWQAKTGKQIFTFAHSNEVKVICFSPDNKWFLTGAGWFVYIWDAETGRAHGSPINLGNGINTAMFLRDSDRILSASADGRAVLWDVATGARLRAFGPIRNALSADVSPEEGRVAAAGNAAFGHVWDLVAGELITPPIEHAGRIRSIRFSPEGRYLLTASDDNTARIWDARNGQAMGEPLYHHGSVRSAEFTPDGHRVLTVAEGNAAFMWEIRLGQPLPTQLPHHYGVSLVAFSPDGKRAATVSWDKIIRIWDCHSGELLTNTMVHSPQYVTSLAYSPDGNRILTTSHYGVARVWNANSAAELCPPLRHWDSDSFQMNKGLWHGAFSPDATRVVTASSDGTARVWHTLDGTQLLTLSHGDAVRTVQFSADGNRILTASRDGITRIWQTQDGRLLLQINHQAEVNTAEFSRDGRQLVTALGDKTARIWNAHNGDLIGAPMEHQDAVVSASFSPDGKKVLTRCGNGAFVWSVPGSAEPVVLMHGGAVESAVFSPDSVRVLTASLDRTARVWDAQTGHPLSERIQHRGQVNDARFSPDGRWILTAEGGVQRASHRALIFDVPIAAHPALWLADLADALAGQHQIKDGNSIKVAAPEELIKLRHRLSTEAAGDPATRWAKWFFGDTAQRTISASSSVTVQDYVRQRITEGSVPGLEQATALSRTNGSAAARLVLVGLTNGLPKKGHEFLLAEWQARNAAELSVNDPDVWLTRARLSDMRGKQEEATAAYCKFLEITKPYSSSDPVFFLKRLEVFHKIHRMDEAAAYVREVLQCRPRDRQTLPTLIDLSAFYNWPLGPTKPALVMSDGDNVQLLSDVPFDIRASIRLAGHSSVLPYPREVIGIKVFQKFRQLHVLHFVYGREAEGAEIGAFRMHYADNKQHIIPIKYGHDVRTWGLTDLRTDLASTNAAIVWQGIRNVSKVRLFKATWDNPHPGSEVKTIDFVSKLTGSDPVLVAITVEP